MDTSIILVDDDRDFLQVLKIKLAAGGFENIRTEDRPEYAVSLFENGAFFDVALIDMTMPELSGIEVLEAIKTFSPRTECIMVTAVNDARKAVECLRKGAYDYLVKPVTKEDLLISMTRTLERKRLLDILDIEKSPSLPRLKNSKPFKPIITRSRKIQKILKEAELHADSNVPVLITGDSGTGKELLARAIHAASKRAPYLFTPINMASLTASLFESEFFGHTRGAFTGAENGRKGYLENTHKGTLFLDEIGTLPMDLQGKLLRVLQDGEYFKLGTSRHQKVDVRIVAATNENLGKQLDQNKFRKDLYYRIQGGWLHLPPLTDRKEDIPLLAEHFIKIFSSSKQKEKLKIESSAMEYLMNYDYPGNIRELKSIIQSAANLSDGNPITPLYLPDYIIKLPKFGQQKPSENNEAVVPLAKMEKIHILKTYKKLNQNKSKTARVLGIGLNTLRRKLKSYKMS